MLFRDVIAAQVAKGNFDQGSLSRLDYWIEVFGDRELASLNGTSESVCEEFDMAMVRLAERGKLKVTKAGTIRTGEPLAESTLNRYLSEAGMVFKYAKKKKLVPRSFVSPTLGMERFVERPDPERFLAPEEVERIIDVARVLDRRWGKLVALTITEIAEGGAKGSAEVKAPSARCFG